MTELSQPSALIRVASKPLTIGDAIRIHAEARPNQPVISGSDFSPLSFRMLQNEIDDVRRWLRSAGFDRYARIAVALSDNAQAARVIVATTCSATSVPIDPKLTVAEVERCLDILHPSAIIALRGQESAARAVAEQRGFRIIEADFSPELTLAVPTIGPSAPLDEPDPEAPAFILHTSGTTAHPNLVPYSHRNMHASVERVRTWFELTPQDRCLSVTPVHYAHGLATSVFAPLMTGGSIAFPSNPTNVDLPEWFGRLEPTWYSAGPTLHLAIVEKAEQQPNTRTMHVLRFVSTAGAPMAHALHDRMQIALGVPVLEHYGLSETMQVSSNRPPPGPSKAGTCGMPWPGIMKIVGEDGRPLAVGERGEILVNGPSVMAGYLNDSNQAVFVDGWFRTGDIGSLDAEGFLSLHGRKKEIINRGGEKISPLEIDQALMRHPEVAQAAAYAVPHPRLGEDAAAAVVLRPGATVSPAELRDFITEQLALFKVPRRIVVVDRLPQSSAGKVQRKRLSEAFQEKFEETELSEESLHVNLMKLWKRVFKVENVSLDEDFFEKGGDSLLAMEISLELQKLMGRELSESILFEAPTIRELAKRLAS